MADLHLDSLEIRHYRVFKHLTVERLGRVNLLAGKDERASIVRSHIEVR